MRKSKPKNKESVNHTSLALMAMDKASDCVYWVDITGCFIYVNDAAAVSLGYTKTEFLGMNISDIDQDSHREKWKARWKELRLKNKLVMEVVHRAKDGRLINYEVSAKHIESGGEEYICAFAHDITERKQMEEELRIQEARLANALKIASLGNWEYDVKKDVFTFNDNFYALFRTTANEMGGYIMSSRDYANTFIHPDDRFMVASEIKQALETSDPFFVRKLEHRIIYADGKPGFITVRYFVVKDKNGKTVKTYGINQDITRRIQTQEALRRELEINSALADLYTPLVSPATPLHEIAYAVLEHAQALTHSEKGYVSVIDPETGKNVGYTHTRILPKQYIISGDDKSFVFLRNPDGTYKGLWGHSLNTRQAFYTNTPSKDASAKFKLKRFLSVPVLLESELVGQISLANSEIDYTESDLSSVKRLAEFYALAIQRKRFEDKIKHSLDEKVLLLKEIHHRIKNNLQIVISLLHLQTSYLRQETISDYFKDNESRIRSMALIHEKLYQSGEFSEVDFADYVNRLAHDLLQVYRINNSMVNLKLFTEKIPLKIDKAVPCGLLLNELVLNSLKHAFKGGRDNTISITLKKTPDQKILLVVADNGIGLPANITISSPRTLGLSLIVSLSGQLNGTISMGNKNGTRFQIIFEG
jgi:PAS domain S-box-containing protein